MVHRYAVVSIPYNECKYKCDKDVLFYSSLPFFILRFKCIEGFPLSFYKMAESILSLPATVSLLYAPSFRSMRETLKHATPAPIDLRIRSFWPIMDFGRSAH